TQFPGAGRTDKNVVGYPFFPVYTAKAGGFFFIVFGVTTLLAGLVQINPIWLYGPYDPAIVSAGTQPDWYVGWLDGALRIFPGVETRIFGFTLPWNVIFPGLVMMGAFYTLAALYPFLEQWVTGDKREHHVLDRPRNAPTRTAIGTAVMAFYGILWLAAANDLIADWFELSSAQLTRTFRLTVIVVPVLVFILTRRICVGLQRRDRDRVLHGRETGIIKRLPHGEFMEVHEPISEREIYELTQHDQYAPLPALPASDHNGVAARSSIGSRARVRLSGWYYGTQIPKPTRAEVEAAWAHHGGLDGATHEAEIEHEERAANEIEAADQGELGTRR
ncbi:MAG: ubiquinol-cytochrome c reductase cytochrome b subunit, partial [Sporichthyaceae bacterium]|nr:ubiquinol-cytochrome c reductase cytochrome b subunit [Sporichthyaceae bacterium]